MKKINYKCSSCGGKVDYDDNNVLICTYCNKTFDSVIKNELDVNNIIEKMEVYAYYCRKCNYEYKTKNDISGTTLCPKCNQKLEKDKQIINGLIPMTMSQQDAKSLFHKALKKIRKKIPKEFFESNLKLEYIRCRVYEGTIKATAQKDNQTISKEYQIYNLPIPTTNRINYNQKKALLSINLDTKKALYNKEKLEQFLDIKDLCIDFSKDTEIENLKEACIKDFRRFKFIVEEDVIAESFIDTKHNFYLPAYSSSTSYNGKIYYNYMFCIGDDILFCFDFPEFVEKKHKQSEKNNPNKRILALLSIILFFAIPGFLGNFFMITQKDNPKIAFMLTTISFISCFILCAIITKTIIKKHKQKKSVDNFFENGKITKEEYFDQVIAKYTRV